MAESLMTYVASIAVLWIAVGIWMVIKTRSRGWRADVAFVFLWPLHWYIEIWKGR